MLVDTYIEIKLMFRTGVHSTYIEQHMYVFISTSNVYIFLPCPHRSELSVLMDSNYIEHDAFALFSHLMRAVREWFVQDPSFPMVRKMI